MEQCQITWLGHSCFQISLDNHRILLDPYQNGYVPGLAPLEAAAHEVYCSHAHGDHNARELVRPLPEDGKRPFRVTVVATDHDTEQGCLRGKNAVHILESRELRIAHLGDLGHPLTKEQAGLLAGLDVLMIPVGGYYTIGPEEARQAVAQLRPKVVIPMHYRGEGFGFPVLAAVDDFLDLEGDCVLYPGNTITVTQASRAHVAVLTYQGGRP